MSALGSQFGTIIAICVGGGVATIALLYIAYFLYLTYCARPKVDTDPPDDYYEDEEEDVGYVVERAVEVGVQSQAESDILTAGAVSDDTRSAEELDVHV